MPTIGNLGSPLQPAGGSTGSDDPIGGFSILQADSTDALQHVLADHPHTAHGGNIEVLEILPIPEM